MRKRESIFEGIDLSVLSLYYLLVFIGFISVLAAVYNPETFSLTNLSLNYNKQLLFIVASTIIGLLILSIEGRLIEPLSFPFYLLTLILLVAVLFFGAKISGARSWFQIGAFSLQPGEFAKLSTAMMVATVLGSATKKNFKKKVLLATLIVAIPALLILPQPDLGSTVVFSSFLLVFYREGLSIYFVLIALALAVFFILALVIDPLILSLVLGGFGLFVAILWRRSRAVWITTLGVTAIVVLFVQSVDFAFYNLLEDRHRNRINIMLGKAHDPKGIGYNTHQSMIAIGSGGFWGKGFLQGTQTKYDFVPEQQTDFIFCTIGEEWGFVGSFTFITIFLLFIYRILVLAERQKLAYARIFAYSVASILFFHFAVNIAMTIGLFPVIGIPLPFISSGGSSMLAFSMMIFILLRLDTYRTEIL
ncbi:rod shape-determining protein RodA [Thermaurantimonas aggregans]|uniref:Cell wall polymerase n=1 Tax=Thermaurantimonas aggregans TaxID=2173829 RepID=A0A401XMZ5_9FLAO|nr:rod shape-determining protein RodA [Thermaurantimonas aggregans]MCX8148135.1 rod shape-determining protein RodA [Thermaurantimonas aggregans]GCD78362.1 rod shape-determining protein RodA [Thermaurantimonas aggregans]